MKNTLRRVRITLIAISVAAVVAVPRSGFARTQEARALKVPSTVHGLVGGESHDAYRLDVRKGEHLVVRLGWRAEKGTRAEATLSTSAAFENAEPLTGGKWSADGREWTGTVGETGTIYVYVVAHPSAHYTLRILRK